MGEAISHGDKDKKKKPSKSSTSSSTQMVLSECLMAYRTRYTDVSESVLKSVVRGLTLKDQTAARHAAAVALRAVHAPGANLAAISKILLPHVGLDNVVLPVAKDEFQPPTPKSSSLDDSSSSIKLHGINTKCVAVRATWVRVCARLAQTDKEAQITNDVRGKWRTELCDFLLDESERVAFAAMEGLIGCGWTALSKLNVSSPIAFVTIPVLQAIRTRLIAALASSGTPVVHYAARVAKQLGQCYMKYFEAASIEPPSPRRSRSMSGNTAPFAKPGPTSAEAPASTNAKGITGLDLRSLGGGSSSSMNTPTSGSSTSRGAQPSTPAANPSATGYSMMRKPTQAGMVAGRGRTWTKTEPASFDGEHPLRDLKGALHIVYKNHRSTFVRAQVLSTLIWLEYSWNAFEIEDLLLRERTATQTALHDDVFTEFLERAILSPPLIDSLLRVYYEHFAHSPARLNLSLLMQAWNRIASLGPAFRVKVLHSIFAFLDHPVKKETRSLIYHIHKVLYWHLGEQGVGLAGEVCAELPKSSTIANDEPHFPIANSATRAIVSRLELAITTSPWEIRAIATEALAKFAFRASYPVRLRAYTFLKLVAKAEGAALYPIATPFIELLDRIFALRRAWAFTYQSGGKLSLANLVQLQSDIDDLRNDLTPYCLLGNLNPVGSDLDPFLASGTSANTNISGSSPSDPAKSEKKSKKDSSSPSRRLASEASASSGIGTSEPSSKSTKVKRTRLVATSTTSSSGPTVNLLSSVNATLAATAADDAASTKTRRGRSGSISAASGDKEKKSKKDKKDKEDK